MILLFTKIFAIILALLVISKTFYDYRKKQESFLTFLFWTVTWLFIVYVALSPSTFYSYFSGLTSENVGVGTFIGIAFIFLFFITYRIYVKANRLELMIREIVMKIGVKDIDDDSKDDK